MKTVIEMAREAGFEIDCCSLEWHDKIERFAELVRAAEREACAKVCEDMAYVNPQPHTYAAAIRARENT